MKSFRKLASSLLFSIGLAALAVISPSAHSQTADLLLLTGGEGNTYHNMGTYLGTECKAVRTSSGKTVSVGVGTSTGTVSNMNALLNNKGELMFGQEDVLFIQTLKNENVRRLKTLMTLHPEEIHVLAPVKSGIQESDPGKTMMGVSFGKREVVFKNFGDLLGYKMAAFGGAVETAKLVLAKTTVGVEVVTVKSFDDALAALEAGKVQAIFMVAGAQSDLLLALPEKKFKFLQFTDDLKVKVVEQYSGAQLNYPNIEPGGASTITTRAGLYARDYQDPAMIEALRAFQDCAAKAAVKARSVRGTHPKWMQVAADIKPKWEAYSFPKEAQAAPAKAKK